MSVFTLRILRKNYTPLYFRDLEETGGLLCEKTFSALEPSSEWCGIREAVGLSKILFGLLIFLLLAGGFLLGVNLDLFLNLWIKGLQLSWWNMFTTEHYIAWLYARNFTAFLLLTVLFSALIASVLAVKKEVLFR